MNFAILYPILLETHSLEEAVYLSTLADNKYHPNKVFSSYKLRTLPKRLEGITFTPSKDDKKMLLHIGLVKQYGLLSAYIFSFLRGYYRSAKKKGRTCRVSLSLIQEKFKVDAPTTKNIGKIIAKLQSIQVIGEPENHPLLLVKRTYLESQRGSKLKVSSLSNFDIKDMVLVYPKNGRQLNLDWYSRASKERKEVREKLSIDWQEKYTKEHPPLIDYEDTEAVQIAPVAPVPAPVAVPAKQVTELAHQKPASMKQPKKNPSNIILFTPILPAMKRDRLSNEEFLKMLDQQDKEEEQEEEITFESPILKDRDVEEDDFTMLAKSTY